MTKVIQLSCIDNLYYKSFSANEPPVFSSCQSDLTVELYETVTIPALTVTDMYGGTSVVTTTFTPVYASGAPIATTIVVTHTATTLNDPIQYDISTDCTYTISVRSKSCHITKDLSNALMFACINVTLGHWLMKVKCLAFCNHVATLAGNYWRMRE